MGNKATSANGRNASNSYSHASSTGNGAGLSSSSEKRARRQQQQQQRRGSASITASSVSAAGGGLQWDPLSSPHAHSGGGSGGGGNGWSASERALLKSTFADLSSRSASGKAIDRETFLKFFAAHVPAGMLGERLFRVFNRSNSGEVDQEEFLGGLASYCRGTPEQKVSFLYALFNLAGNGRCTRGEMETMCNAVLIAAEAMARGVAQQQSAAAAAAAAVAHTKAAEASVAQSVAAAANVAKQDQLNVSMGLPSGRAAGVPAAHAQLLSEHLARMKIRAHSPSFQYSPPPESLRVLASTLVDADADAGGEGRIDEDSSTSTAPGSAVAAASDATPVVPGLGAAAAAHALSMSGQPQMLPASAASASSSSSEATAGASSNSTGNAAISASSFASPEPVTPLQEPDWLHATRVKAMVDDAFGPSSSSGGGASGSAGADSATAAASSSSDGGASASSSSEGLSIYSFGAWLQMHPEIISVIDAAFMGYSQDDGLLSNHLFNSHSFPAGGAGSNVDDGASTAAHSHLHIDANNGGGDDLYSAGPLRGSLMLSARRASSGGVGGGGGGGGGSLASSSPQGSSAAGCAAVGVSHGGGFEPALALLSERELAREAKDKDKQTWRDGPRLSLSSSAPPMMIAGGTGLMNLPALAMAASSMPGSSRGLGGAGLIAPRGGGGAGNGNHNVNTLPGAGGISAGPSGRFSVSSGTAPAGLQSYALANNGVGGSNSPFAFRCDSCDFSIVMRHCMACGKQLQQQQGAASANGNANVAPTATTSLSSSGNSASASAAAATPTASASSAAAPITSNDREFACAHCSVQLFGCGVPRFCLCCGADVRSQQHQPHLQQQQQHQQQRSLPHWGSMSMGGRSGSGLLLQQLQPRLTSGSVVGGAAGAGGTVPSSQQLQQQQPRQQQQHVVVEGYLKKVGARLKTILSRWYVIRDSFMYSYTKPTDVRPAHVLFLAGCFVEAVSHEEKNSKLKYGIEIILSEEGPVRKSRVLYASSLESRQQWLDAIRVHANVHDIEEYYSLGPELGVGRFSSVREGVSKSSGRRVAVKIIDKSGLSEPEREALRTEVAVLKLVHHPNIIRLKSVFETRKQLFLVLTFLKGGDLFDRLVKRKRFPEHTVQTIMLQLCQVVLYLHVRGIVHRDIKPENVLLRDDNSDTDLMLTDFGLGAFALPDQSMKTSCGTLTFTAPEVLSGRGYGYGCDLWSLGVMLFLLIRGRLPFDGKSAEEIRERVCTGRYAFDETHQAWKECSQECKNLIVALLTVDPAHRLTIQQALEHPFFKLKLQTPAAIANNKTVAAPSSAAATAGAAASGSAAGAASGASVATPGSAGGAAAAATLVPPAVSHLLVPLAASHAAGTPSATPVTIVAASSPSPTPVLPPAPAANGAAASAPMASGGAASDLAHASMLRIHSASPSALSSLTSNNHNNTPNTPALDQAMLHAHAAGLGLSVHSIDDRSNPHVAPRGTHSAASSVADLPALLVPGSAAASPMPIMSPLSGHAASPFGMSAGGAAAAAALVAAPAAATVETTAASVLPSDRGSSSTVSTPSSAMAPIRILQYPLSGGNDGPSGFTSEHTSPELAAAAPPAAGLPSGSLLASDVTAALSSSRVASEADDDGEDRIDGDDGMDAAPSPPIAVIDPSLPDGGDAGSGDGDGRAPGLAHAASHSAASGASDASSSMLSPIPCVPPALLSASSSSHSIPHLLAPASPSPSSGGDDGGAGGSHGGGGGGGKKGVRHSSSLQLQQRPNARDSDDEDDGHLLRIQPGARGLRGAMGVMGAEGMFKRESVQEEEAD